MPERMDLAKTPSSCKHMSTCQLDCLCIRLVKLIPPSLLGWRSMACDLKSDTSPVSQAEESGLCNKVKREIGSNLGNRWSRLYAILAYTTNRIEFNQQ